MSGFWRYLVNRKHVFSASQAICVPASPILQLAKFRLSRTTCNAGGAPRGGRNRGAFKHDFVDAYPPPRFLHFDLSDPGLHVTVLCIRSLSTSHAVADCKKCIPVDTQEPHRPAAVEVWSSGQPVKRLACASERCVLVLSFCAKKNFALCALDGEP